MPLEHPVRVALHQPDLLPYSGFWFKMAHSDLFILSIHDQFQKRGYQRRVRMRGTWVSHQLVGNPGHVPITTISVRPGWQDRLIDAIRGRYVGARFWAERGPDLLDRIAACRGTTLVDVNVGLIEMIRNLLGITTPLVITEPPRGRATARLIEQVHMVGGTVYLSGTGGYAYMGDDADAVFAAHGLGLEFSDHRMSTGDSIVTGLLDYADPLADILRRHATPTAA